MSNQPDFQNATWVNSEQAQEWCAAHPNSPLCSVVRTHYEYSLWLAPNAIFLGVFAASLVGFVVTYLLTRRTLAFTIAFILGCIGEVIGYAGRVMNWDNPWDENGFLIQICCLTIAPAFLAAGCYLCLRRIVAAFGPENSRIPPEYYTRIFIPCDILSLVLQALGGALASTAVSGNDSPDLGSNIMIAGLSTQVATVFAFVLASIDFAIRTYRSQKRLGSSAALNQDPVMVTMRSTLRFKGFLVALAIATLCILWRSAFRVAELSEGWTGPIMGDQGMFVGFEGVLMVVAVLVLNVCHPAFCAGPLFEGDGGLHGLWFSKGRGKGKKERNSTSEEKYLSSGNPSPPATPMEEV